MTKKSKLRILSLLLCLTMLVGYLPLGNVRAAEADNRVADPSTMDDWKDLFLSNSLNTENAGAVWTDKSVFKDSLAFKGTGITQDDDQSFLVALSAIASNMSVTGISNIPTDTMMILDMSSSMYNGFNKQPDTVQNMVDAVNSSIVKLQALNAHNRVGVVIYYGGSTRAQSDSTCSTVLLPLDRYSGTTEFLKANVSNNKLLSLSVNSGVKNSAGKTMPTTTHDAVDIAGTYAQLGIIDALNEFLNTEKDMDRTPVFIFMSDGAPTAATYDYSNKGNATMGNNTVGMHCPNETDFVTQLTAAYAKEMADQHYTGMDAVFYSLSLGSSISLSVMDPETNTSTTTQGYWNKLVKDGSVDISVYNYTGAWSNTTEKKTYTVNSTTVGGKTFPSSVEARNYVDKAFTAQTASNLTNAFENILDEITLVSKYMPTLITDNADMSGYVSFVDKVGKYMKVTDIKGILIDNKLYSGAELAKNFITGGGNLGTYDDPKPLGDELVWSVRDRLGISTVPETRSLLGLAYRSGQLSYTSDSEYSNYIGWYANAQGKFLGFWHEGTTTLPTPTGNIDTDPAYIIRSYIYLGAVDEAQGVEASDMMYATVQVRESIKTGEQSVAFAIPAALIPIVSYDVKLDKNNNPTALNVSGADHPIRLVYEVALDEAIDEFTIKDVVSADYLAANTSQSGEVSFYTNQYEVDNTVGYGKVNAYSYFNPSRQNDKYYYVSDTSIYSDKNGTLYKGNTQPTGTYYRAKTVYEKSGSTVTAKTVYKEISAQSLATAVRAADGSWYIKEGNVHVNMDGYTVNKSQNPTDTLSYSYIPFVDTHNHHVGDTGYNFIIGATLGNNGSLTLMPTTGLSLSKAMADGVSAPTSGFRFTITNLTDSDDDTTYPARLLHTDGTSTDTTVTFADGVANVSLLAGQTILVGDMTDGTKYSVKEVETLEYVAQNSTVEVTTKAHTLEKVTFVNEERGTGDLTINKQVTHELGGDHVIPDNLRFTIDVQLKGLGTANAEFDASHTDGSITSVKTDENGFFTVYLGHGDTVRIKDLPAGTIATVLERNPSSGFTPMYMNGITRSDGVVTIVKDQTSSVAVVNHYAPGKADPVNVELNGIKNLTTAAPNWNGAEFEFSLQKWTGDSWVTIATTTASESNPAFNFNAAMQAEKFTATGVYSYRVIETNGGKTINGITYDATAHTFSVTVTDSDMNGSLEISKVTSNHSGRDFEINPRGNWQIDVTFTNKYEATGCDVVLDVQKALTNLSGSPLVSLDGFRFGLYDQSGNLFARSELSNGIGEARFILHYELEDTGTHTYTLKEIVPNNPVNGMIYSDASYTVVVEVVDLGNGTTTAKIISINGNNTYETPVFTNIYKPDDASLRLDFAKKTLSGRDMVAGEFTFQLRGTNNNMVRNGSNDASGNIVFDSALVFDKVGTYTFDLTETSTNGNGVTTDTAVYHVTVTVTDNGGTLVASYQITNSVSNTVTFANTYQPKAATYTVSGNKILQGRPLLNEEFTFLLTRTNAAGNPIDGENTLKAKNYVDGSFSFPALTFTEEGTYYYKVSEQPLTGDPHGVSCDDTVYFVTITVRDDLKGALLASAKISGADKITFINRYTPAPTDAVIPGSKILNGKVMGDGDFSFELYASDASWSVGNKIETVNNKADGSFSFSPLRFSTVGTHYYLIREKNYGQTIDGITYDDTVYRISIDVTDDLRGHLVATATVTNNNDIPYDSPVFVNIYRITGEANVKLNGTKRLEGAQLTDGAFTFELYKTDDSFTVNGNAINTTVNTNGAFEFNLNYTPSDVGNTYYYAVREKFAGQTINGITYSSVVYRVTVEVQDNGLGGIKTVTSITDGSKTVNSLDYSNAYTDPDDLPLDLLVKKIIKNVGSEKIGPEGFRFLMKDADGNTWTVSSGADAMAKFSLTYTKDDIGKTYTYRITEINDGKENVQYSTAEYIISVSVSLDEGNCLIASITCNNEKVEAVAVEFENVYDYTLKAPEAPPTGDYGIIPYMSSLMLSAAALIVLINLRKKFI